jgi:phage-related protein
VGSEYFVPANDGESIAAVFAFMRTLVVPHTEVIFYREGDSVPVREWLKSLPSKVARKCLLYLDMLEQHGHELRRPIADFLTDGIYELRPTIQGVNYRMLYFFSGRNVVVVSHGIVKESEVPKAEIDRAIQRSRSFEVDPESHSYRRPQ